MAMLCLAAVGDKHEAEDVHCRHAPRAFRAAPSAPAILGTACTDGFMAVAAAGSEDQAIAEAAPTAEAFVASGPAAPAAGRNQTLSRSSLLSRDEGIEAACK
jgi:hypothetical protein